MLKIVVRTPLLALLLAGVIGVVLYSAAFVGAQESDPPDPSSLLVVEATVYGPDSGDLPGGRPDYGLGGGSDRRRTPEESGSVEVLQAADVTRPDGLVLLKITPSYQKVVRAYEIERSITAYVGAVPANLTDADYEVIVPESANYIRNRYPDWDVVPGYHYGWRVTANFTDGTTAQRLIRPGEVMPVDRLAAVGTAGGVRLWMAAHSLATVEKRVDRFDHGEGGTAADYTFDNDKVSFTDSGFDDVEVSGGELSRYTMAYYRAPQSQSGDLVVHDRSNEVVVQSGVHPLPPAQVEYKLEADHVYVEWFHVGVPSQVASYLVERKVLNRYVSLAGANGIPWEPIGTTRLQEYRDWTAVLGGVYAYRVTPVDFGNKKGPVSEPVRVGDYVVQCVVGPEELWHAASTPSTQAEIQDVSSIVLNSAGVLSDGNEYAGHHIDHYSISTLEFRPTALRQCRDTDLGSYTVERKLTYAHGFNEGLCPPGVSCDYVGGSSSRKIDDYELFEADDHARVDWQYHNVLGFSFHHHPLYVYRFHHQDGLAPGMYQYEYRVCTKGTPPVCSGTYRTGYEMVGTDRIPLIVVD